MQTIKVLSSDLLPLILETIEKNQPFQLMVTGSSMRPFLRDKKTTVTLTSVNGLKKYDIILYEDINQKLILHRIAKLSSPLVVCGDALKHCELVNKTQVIAKVTRIEQDTKVTYVHQGIYKFKVAVWVLLKPIRPILMRIFFRRT